jgi:hypothetical protein
LLGVDIQSETSITKHFNGKETFGLVALGDLLENGDRFLISACVRSDRLASEERERSPEIDQPFETSHFCGGRCIRRATTLQENDGLALTGDSVRGNTTNRIAQHKRVTPPIVNMEYLITVDFVQCWLDGQAQKKGSLFSPPAPVLAESAGRAVCVTSDRIDDGYKNGHSQTLLRAKSSSFEHLLGHE